MTQDKAREAAARKVLAIAYKTSQKDVDIAIDLQMALDAKSAELEESRNTNRSLNRRVGKLERRVVKGADRLLWFMFHRYCDHSKECRDKVRAAESALSRTREALEIALPYCESFVTTYLANMRGSDKDREAEKANLEKVRAALSTTPQTAEGAKS